MLQYDGLALGLLSSSEPELPEDEMSRLSVLSSEVLRNVKKVLSDNEGSRCSYWSLRSSMTYIQQHSVRRHLCIRQRRFCSPRTSLSLPKDTEAFSQVQTSRRGRNICSLRKSLSGSSSLCKTLETLDDGFAATQTFWRCIHARRARSIGMPHDANKTRQCSWRYRERRQV